MKKPLLYKTALALALATPLFAAAESNLETGSATASARLDLRVVIPRVLYLGVGAGTGSLADDGTISLLNFDLTGTPDAVGNGVATAAQSVAVRVFGNNGQITLASDATADLVSGADTLPLSQITVTSDSADLPVPAFGGGTANPTLTGKVTNQTANWSYTYENDNVVAAGDYTARVTYTAAMP